MSPPTRSTFTQVRDVLQHAIGYLGGIRDLMDDLRTREHSERVKLLLQSFETEQRNLHGALERYLDDAPDKVLDTYAQYTVALPESLAGPEEPLSTLALTQWLLGLNQHLVDMFTELAAAAPPGEVRQVFATMADQVRAHDRRLSKEYQRFEDL